MNVWGALEGGVTHPNDTSASVSIATVTAEQYIAKMGAFFTQLHIIYNNYTAVTADDGQS